MDKEQKPPKKQQSSVADDLSKEKYLERLLASAAGDKQNVNKVYRAALKAIQYEAYSTNNEQFHLLEGTVKKNAKGEYIFTPDKHLREYLETSAYPALLKLEESRFTELMKLALSELKE